MSSVMPGFILRFQTLASQKPLSSLSLDGERAPPPLMSDPPSLVCATKLCLICSRMHAGIVCQSQFHFLFQKLASKASYASQKTAAVVRVGAFSTIKASEWS